MPFATEYRLLGNFFLFPEEFRYNLEELFQSESNRQIYRAMEGEMGNFNPAIIAEKLEHSIPNPFGRISEILNFTVTTKEDRVSSDIAYCIKALKERRVKRTIAEMVNNQATFNLDDITKELNRYDLNTTQESGVIRASDFMEIKADNLNYYQLGIPTFDKRIGGLLKGDLVTIMSRPGVGKTWAMLNVLLNMHRNHKEETFAFFSLEMKKAPILERVLQLNFCLSRSIITKDYLKLNESDIGKLTKQLSRVFLFVENYSIDDIAEAIKRTKAGIAFIDFLDLISTDGDKSPYERVSAIILRLKQIAKKMDIILFVAHQLSRSAEDGSIPVRLHHGRDSGKIEDNSDFIIGAWRPEIADGKKEEQKIVLSLLKNKRGPAGTVVCHYDKNYWKITEQAKP